MSNNSKTPKHLTSNSPAYRPHKTRGFSLIELMIGLALIGILASIALPAYSAYTISVRESAAMARLTHIAMALEQYYGESQHYQADLPTLRIPDSDAWFDYRIDNPDRFSYQIDAIPEEDSNQPIAFRLDHLGRQLHRSDDASEWQAGWP